MIESSSISTKTQIDSRANVAHLRVVLAVINSSSVTEHQSLSFVVMVIMSLSIGWDAVAALMV
jgi:hypothetical protein